MRVQIFDLEQNLKDLLEEHKYNTLLNDIRLKVELTNSQQLTKILKEQDDFYYKLNPGGDMGRISYNEYKNFQTVKTFEAGIHNKRVKADLQKMQDQRDLLKWAIDKF